MLRLYDFPPAPHPSPWVPMNIDFPFSDLIAGYVTHFDDDRDTFELETSDGDRKSVV